MALWSKITGIEGTDELQVRIQTPEGLIWEGRAQSVSSQNSAGAFDILPDHANIITLIERQPITIIFSGGQKEFTFEKAIISFRENKLSIYADITPGSAAEKA